MSGPMERIERVVSGHADDEVARNHFRRWLNGDRPGGCQCEGCRLFEGEHALLTTSWHADNLAFADDEATA